MSPCARSLEIPAASATAISSLFRAWGFNVACEALCAVFEFALFFVELVLLIVTQLVTAYFAERFLHR